MRADGVQRRFSVPVAQLAVADGVIPVAADPSRRVTYGESIGGRWNERHAAREQHRRRPTGPAHIKTVQQLKIVGQSPQRYDIPPKVDGLLKLAVDMKVPGMLHARNVKPPVAGATLVSIDESSLKEGTGTRQSGEQRELRRGRLRARGAGDSGGASAQGELEKPGNAAVSCVRRSLPLHAPGDADLQRKSGRRR